MAINIGDILEGKVVNITNFGAFVDMDGTTGLIHVSEIADRFVKDVHDYLSEGDVIKVKVLKMEDNGKISLSLKGANPDVMPKEGVVIEERPKDRKPRANPSSSPRTSSRPPQGEDFSGRGPRSYEKGSSSFEDMMSRFQKDSEEKMAEYKRRKEAGGNTKRRHS